MNVVNWSRYALLAAALAGSWNSPVYAKAGNEADDLAELQIDVSRDWRLVKHDQSRNIKAYARIEDDKPYRSFRVEAVIPASLEAVGHVLLDFANYPRWYWQLTDIRVLKSQPNEYYLYMVHNAPYGVADRDVIVRAEIEPITATKPYAMVHLSAEPNYLPLHPPLVRMRAEDVSIRLIPIADNQVRLEAEGYIDAGGQEPIWATNFVQRSAPYSIVVGLQRMAKVASYQTTPAKALLSSN